MDSKIKLKLNKLLHNGINSDNELRELAKLIDVHIDGIYDIRSISNLPQRGTFIILLRNDNGTGHWVCMHDGEYFDSYGVAAPTKIKAKSNNTIQIQGVDRAYCGVYVMLHLYSVQKNRPDLMRGFENLDVDVSLE